MARVIPAALALSLTLFLAACGGEKKQEGAGKAEGEVLPGSASDAMLPLDTVKSQAPLAPKAETSGETKDVADKEASPQEKAEAPVDEPAEPAAPET